MVHYNLSLEWASLLMQASVDFSHSQYKRDAVLAAHKAFSEMHRRGRRYRLWTSLRRKSPRLYWLYALTGERPLLLRQMSGIQMVRLSDIQGSEKNGDEFDQAFRPLHERSRARWVSVALARALGQSLPPVELIRLGHIYFVRDGHYRVSVARAYGQQKIEANVWVLPAPGTLSHVTSTMNVPSWESVPFLTADST